MANWFQRQFFARFAVRDVRKTIRAVKTLPAAVEHVVALRLAERIHQDQLRLSEAPNQDQVLRELLMRVSADRHRALVAGARSWDDPEWAVAALEEAWLMGLSGALGKAAEKQINKAIKAFIDHSAHPFG